MSDEDDYQAIIDNKDAQPGFARQFDAQLRKIVEETSVHGSGATVSNIIKLVEKQNARPFTHRELRALFSLDRQILAKDF